MLLVIPGQHPCQQLTSAILAFVLSLSGITHAAPLPETPDFSADAYQYAPSIRSVAEDIEYLTAQIEAMDDNNEIADGTAAAIYTALGILTTGITNNLLLTHLQPAAFPFLTYQNAVTSNYARAALAGLSNYIVPSILAGVGIGSMTNTGALPAMSEAEIRGPLLLGATLTSVLTMTHTLLSSLVPQSLASIPLHKSPDTVAMIGIATVLTGMAVYFGWNRINKEQQYQRLLLGLKDLRHQLPPEEEPDNEDEYEDPSL